MKTRLVVFCVFFWSTFCCIAQLELQGYSLAGTSIILVSGTNSPKSFEEKFGFSSTLGLSGKYYLGSSNRLFLKSGISLNYLSNQFKYEDSYAEFAVRLPFEPNNVTVNNASVLVTVPAAVGYSFGKLSIDAGLGFSLNLYQHNRFGWDEGINDYRREVREKNSEGSRNNYLLCATANLEYVITERLGIILNVNAGITQYFKLQSPELNPNYKSRIHSSSLGVGYTFN